MTVQTIRTPCKYFDLISGGLRFSTLVELWGANQAGKSTFCYQTAGMFMKDYPNGRLKLITPEGIADNMRMKYAFNLDMERVDQIKAPTIESGFYEIGNSIKNTKTPTIILWDTISATPTKSALENQKEAKDEDKLNRWSGGQGERPQLIKYFLRNLMSEIIDNQPVIVMIPNQVFASMERFVTKEKSGEGNALKHDLHYSFHFSCKDKDITYDETTGLADFTLTNVELTKSKFCPKFEWKPLYIDNTMGGVIDITTSLALTAFELGLIFKVRSPNDGRKKAYAIGSEEEPVILGEDWEAIQRDEKLMKQIELDLLKRMLKKNFIIKMMYIEEYGKGDLVNELLKDDTSREETN